MNYYLIYNKLMEKRKANPATTDEYGYVECHHIVPRDEGGSNDDTNLVYLTAREHYIAHLLLTKIYNTAGMYYAYVMMSKGNNEHTKRQYHINSRLYEKLKLIRNRKLCGKGNGMFGRHHSKETKEKIRKKMIGHKLSPETRMKISKALTGKHITRTKPMTQEARMNISKALKGRKLSESHKQKLSDSWRKRVVLQYDLEGNFIKEWSSVREVRIAFNCTDATIRMCCIGKHPRAKGYIWKYKDEVEE